MDFHNNGNYPGGNDPNGNYPGGNYPHSGQNSYGPPVRIPGGNFATTAMVFGIISIVTALMMTVYFPFIFGSLAIVFALLSKGGAARLMKQAKTGIICASVGLVANLIIVISSVTLILSNPDILRQTARMYDEMYEQTYGQSSEEVLGHSLEDMVDEMLGQMK